MLSNGWRKQARNIVKAAGGALSPRRHSRGRPWVRLSLEPLEDRLLLSAGPLAAAFDSCSGLLALLGPAVVRSAGDVILVEPAGGAAASSDPASPQFNPALAGLN